MPVPAVLPSLERTVPLSCSSLILSQMLQLPSPVPVSFIKGFQYWNNVGKGAGKVLKIYIASKTVISVGRASTEKFFSKVSTSCILCLSE